MTEANFHALHYKRGRVVERRDVHNAFLPHGRAWLSRLVGFSSIVPAVTETEARIRYLGLGMGSTSAGSVPYDAEFLAAYPPGFDPNATSGNLYQTINPTGPPISTLERPVRVSGSQDPYLSAPSSDVWLYENIVAYYQDLNSVTFRQVIDATAGELVYGTFTRMPISEAALFNDAAGVNVNAPYNLALSYVQFSPIVLTVESVIDLSWSIRFCS